jgi:hypothetical protein
MAQSVAAGTLPSTAEQIAEGSPRFKVRLAGVFYSLTILTGILSLVVSSRIVVPGDAASTAKNILEQESLFRWDFRSDLIATACYVVVTGVFYELFKPVSRSVSLIAAFFSLVCYRGSELSLSARALCGVAARGVLECIFAGAVARSRAHVSQAPRSGHQHRLGFFRILLPAPHYRCER